MKFKELPAWPPDWSGSDRSATGEVGVLKSYRALYRQSNYVAMVIDYDGAEYTGMLKIEPALRHKAVAALDAHKGRTIKEIGEVEIA